MLLRKDALRNDSQMLVILIKFNLKKLQVNSFMPIRKNKCFTQRFFRFSEFIFHSKWQRGGHLLTPANFSGLKSMASSGKSECERWRWKKC